MQTPSSCKSVPGFIILNMKKFFFAILLFPAMLFAQDIPKGTNAITVTGVSFEQVSTALADQNYFVDKKDESVHTIVTLPKADQSSAWKGKIKVILQIRVKDSVAYLSGLYNMESINQASFDPIIKRGARGSIFMTAWDELNNFALSLHREISYAKR